MARIEHFSPVAVADALRETGSAVLRSVWTPEQLRPLRAAIDEYLAEKAETLGAGHLVGANYGTVAMMKDSGRALFAILRDLFHDSNFQRVCVEHFQDQTFVFQPHRLAFRRHDPSKAATFVPFHQDSGSQDPRVKKVLNCWMPLDAGAGRDGPGLQVVGRPGEAEYPLRPAARDGNIYDFVTIDHHRIEAEFSGELVSPEFEIGDGFVFTEHVIHRTFVTPHMTKPRLAFEFRVFSPKYLDMTAAGAQSALTLFSLT